MCGRFALAKFLEKLAEIFAASYAGKYEANFNIAPTNDILMVAIGKDGGRKIVNARWGLVPDWMDIDGNSVLYNARSETLLEKPSFKNAFLKRRCIIPADGFYEWAREGKNRVPYYIERNDEMPLAFAGLWEMKKLGDEILLSASIITTQASEKFSEIHHRFPVTLEQKDWNIWLDKDADVSQLQCLFKAPDDGILNVNKVSSEINKIKNNYAALKDPVL